MAEGYEPQPLPYKKTSRTITTNNVGVAWIGGIANGIPIRVIYSTTSVYFCIFGLYNGDSWYIKVINESFQAIANTQIELEIYWLSV